MKILKFGSSTLSSAERFKEVADIIKREKEKKVVVLSAIDGTTQELSDIADYLYRKNPDGAKELVSMLEQKYQKMILELFGNEKSKEIQQHVSDKFNEIRDYSDGIFTLFEEKRIVALGGQLSSYLMTQYLGNIGVKAVNIPALSFMKTDKNGDPDEASIKADLADLLSKEANTDTFTTEGSICKNAYNEVDRLEMGGNDYTAALIGAALHASSIEFWSDSVGVYNNNPNIVKDAKPVEALSFDEAAELSYFLTRIIHPTSILPAKLANVPVRLMSIGQKDGKGTIISTHFNQGKIEAVASKDGITSILIKSGRMLFAHGFLRRVFEVFESYKTAIDMITTSEVGVSLTIDNARNIDDIVNDLRSFGTVSYQENMTIVSVIGHLPEDNVGFQAEILSALDKTPIRMISYGGSAHNLSFLIQTKYKEEALKALNNKLFQ